MFAKITSTKYTPDPKPVLIWDGECGFCKYWVTRWKHLTNNRIQFKTYQEAAAAFPDIPLKEFKKASRFIATNGAVFSGPDSAYKSYTFSNKALPWHRWYQSYGFFTWVSDHGYNFIAKHRSFFFTLTKVFFGKNPEQLKPYWVFYLFAILGILYALLKFL